MRRDSDTVSARTFSATTAVAATAIAHPGSVRYAPRPAVKPRRFAPASPSIARSRTSNGSATTDATHNARTPGASDHGTPSAMASATRKAFSARPGETSSPFHRFALAGRMMR